MKKKYSEMRAGQLLTTFGPGSLVDLVDETIIVAGLNAWVYSGQVPIVPEPRLQAKLQARLNRKYIELRLPPIKEEEHGVIKSFIKGYTFPQWVQVQENVPSPRNRGAMRRRLVHKSVAKNFRNEKGKPLLVVPVRFVQACARGHISDIDWKFVVHGTQDCHKQMWMEEDGSSGGLASINVVCDCGKEVNLHQLFKDNSRLGPCRGERPWLGFGSRDTETCTSPKRAIVRSASNTYFPQLMSVISIPEGTSALDVALDAHWNTLKAISELDKLAFLMTLPPYNQALDQFAPSDVFRAIQKRLKGSEPTGDESVKDLEFQAFVSAPAEVIREIPQGDYFARQMKVSAIPGLDVPRFLGKVVAVHKLREVTALMGFTRLEPLSRNVDGEYASDVDLKVEMAQIGLEEAWLPAIENRGEGIFVQLAPDRLAEWKKEKAVDEYSKELEAAFQKWKSNGKGRGIDFPGVQYYLLHTLSHIVLQTLTLECGYPASALKERIYSSDQGAGFLIYTASSDAEGTLGGLVMAGRDLGRLVQQAIESSRLCSNDPLCASHQPGDPDNRPLSGASCHSCLHVPETSCEQWNEFLDRNLIVETLEQKGVEFFR